ncbi:hypothetical protein FEDK69T_16270 [Flavobacterium enshiense DK69]|uniref:DUF2851 domain-containing protein n=1 Tax=Flavobacterium enshiense DK69 TaxID=1107311 RepID=V6S9Y0_9FLAO|nr:DUF2851 family protein [Flavobacterium enshiense]ESU23461.1 hypothetical protein FEDK69T_16270 [Flavobacterium enshiense DK69]KGO96319.1 hypothetical protein Q767_05230 [Flavobacterium enshiense DK69]
MQEDFLHHIWQYRKFAYEHLYTFRGDELRILHPGHNLKKAGPDFFNAQIFIGNQKWAGNIEIHLKSSDWYIHHHENDPAYDAVILHVVWEHDTDVFRADNTEIPVLELQHYVEKEILESYYSLSSTKSWIYCEKDLASIDRFVLKKWQERLFFDRLERKALLMHEQLFNNKNDWEATLFCFLAKNFGLNSNGDSFFAIAASIPFSIMRKEKDEVKNLEALFFGRAGMLEEEKQDVYYNDLKNRWCYLSDKYQLDKVFIAPVQFFKLRPDNFPTIRLAQLAQLYHQQENLFSKMMASESVSVFYGIFDVKVSDYWQAHYQFDKESPKKRKGLTSSFVDLLIINTIIPLRFAFEKHLGEEDADDLIGFLEEIEAEKNVIIDKFSNFGIRSENAFDSQTLLQLKNEYCNVKKCLQCEIGIELLKK